MSKKIETAIGARRVPLNCLIVGRLVHAILYDGRKIDSGGDSAIVWSDRNMSKCLVCVTTEKGQTPIVIVKDQALKKRRAPVFPEPVDRGLKLYFLLYENKNDGKLYGHSFDPPVPAKNIEQKTKQIGLISDLVEYDIDRGFL